MVFNLRRWLSPKARPSTLAEQCAAYLRKGPPPQMTTYVPYSLAEMITAQGAGGKSLDAESRDLAQMILLELADLSRFKDPAVHAYMQEGARLVREVTERS